MGTRLTGLDVHRATINACFGTARRVQNVPRITISMVMPDVYNVKKGGLQVGRNQRVQNATSPHFGMANRAPLVNRECTRHQTKRRVFRVHRERFQMGQNRIVLRVLLHTIGIQ